MSLIADEPHLATVRAEIQTDMLILDRTEFERWFPENFTLPYAIMIGLVKRLRSANRQIESLALLDVSGRVALALLDKAEIEGDQRLIHHQVSPQALAKVVGASRKSVSRTTRHLERRGMIQMQKDGSVVITEEPAALGKSDD